MSCRDFEVLLSLRAAGALDPRDAARVEGHLAHCRSCAADAEDTAAALALARLPEPTEAERRVFRDLPAGALEGVRRSDRRRATAKKYAVAALAVAAAAAFALAPALLRRSGEAPVRTAAAWEQPDLDELWEDTEVLDLDPAALSGGDEPDSAALAAVDL